MAAALAMAVVALVPQLHMWIERGRDWQGSDFSFFVDEAAYEAYVNALIGNRPRLNDPYTGRDTSSAGAPQAESLFSIQFIPAYACALPARLFNLSAAAVFIILWPLAAFATTLALTRLLYAASGDERTAAALALVVLCFCTFIQKAVRLVRGLETAYLPLPFLRRYLPALPFAFFFIFCLLVWRALATDDRRRAASLTNAFLAGLTFALLVYSYFYLWTAAAAWLACFAPLWLAASTRAERRRAARPLVVVAALAALSLAPYAWLLARRAPSMNTVQALVHTRAPDLFRTSELLGALALAIILLGAWCGRLAWRDRGAILSASFALMPFAVFNQQLITGRSLQPIHYEQFVANYVSLAALALATVLVLNGRASVDGARPRRGDGDGSSGGAVRRAFVSREIFAFVALVALGWAAFEVVVATRRASQVNLRADEVRPVYLRLSEMARESAEIATAAAAGGRPVVFSPDIALSNRLPTVAPQAVLWAPHMSVFSGVTLAEERERLYRQLYYSNVDAERFADFISRPHPYRTAVFGSARILNGLDATRAPLTPADLAAEARAYAAYISSFDAGRARRTPLSYVVVAVGQIDLGNIDRWYARDAGERVADHMIYRVRLRQGETMKEERGTMN